MFAESNAQVIARRTRIVIAAITVLAASPVLRGQQTTTPLAPRLAVAYVEVAPSSRDALVTAFRRYDDASRVEAGYQRIELFEQSGRRGHFIIIESWSEPPQLEAHRAAAHTKTYRQTVDTIRVSGYDERPYQPLSVGPSRAPGGDAIHVIAHVDIGGQGTNAPALLTQLAEDSRKEPGSIRFDVLQNTARQNHFTVIETWASEAALNAHAAAAHTRRYRETLQPISGSPLDERQMQAVSTGPGAR
jgi:quinol monooxygenase YgiN